MLREVEAFVAVPPEPLAPFEITEADHGRIEIRRPRVTYSADWLFSDRRYPDEPASPTSPPSPASRSPHRGWQDHPLDPLLLSSAPLTPEAVARAVRGPG